MTDRETEYEFDGVPLVRRGTRTALDFSGFAILSFSLDQENEGGFDIVEIRVDGMVFRPRGYLGLHEDRAFTMMAEALHREINGELTDHVHEEAAKIRAELDDDDGGKRDFIEAGRP